MPLVRISAPQHLDDAQLAHISNAVHDAMVATFNVPADDRFQVLTRHPPGEIIVTPEYLGVAHTSNAVFVQITCNLGRTVEMKKALYALIVEKVAHGGAVGPGDVLISLVEVAKGNWSFGNGLAQYAS
jgi:phenylpyruvate tautomerase PptA (4-oxalocrotonate tautomerase family)